MSVKASGDQQMKAFNIPKKCEDGLFISTKIDSIEERQVLQEVYTSALAKDYVQDWKTRDVTLVHNPNLDNSFSEKKRELKEKGVRTVYEELAFSVEFEENLKTICEDGPRCRESVHSLGKPLLGVSLFRHIDTLLRYAKVMQYGPTLDIIVYKVLLGKPKQVVPREKSSDPYLDPTPNYDCHVSCIKPRLGDATYDLLERSTVYFYEYDESAWPVSHPRQCLPYAVVTYKSLRVTPMNLMQKDISVVHRMSSSDSEKDENSSNFNKKEMQVNASDSHEGSLNVIDETAKSLPTKKTTVGGLKFKILQAEYLRRLAKLQTDSSKMSPKSKSKDCAKVLCEREEVPKSFKEDKLSNDSKDFTVHVKADEDKFDTRDDQLNSTRKDAHCVPKVNGSGKLMEVKLKMAKKLKYDKASPKSENIALSDDQNKAKGRKADAEGKKNLKRSKKMEQNSATFNREQDPKLLCGKRRERTKALHHAHEKEVMNIAAKRVNPVLQEKCTNDDRSVECSVKSKDKHRKAHSAGRKSKMSHHQEKCSPGVRKVSGTKSKGCCEPEKTKQTVNGKEAVPKNSGGSAQVLQWCENRKVKDCATDEEVDCSEYSKDKEQKTYIGDKKNIKRPKLVKFVGIEELDTKGMDCKGAESQRISDNGFEKKTPGVSGEGAPSVLPDNGKCKARKCNNSVADQDLGCIDVDLRSCDDNLTVCDMEISDDNDVRCVVADKVGIEMKFPNDLEQRQIDKRILPKFKSRGRSFDRRSARRRPTYQYSCNGMTYVYTSFQSRHDRKQPIKTLYESSTDPGKEYFYEEDCEFELKNNWHPIKQSEPRLEDAKGSLEKTKSMDSEACESVPKLSAEDALKKLGDLLSEVGKCHIDVGTITSILNFNVENPTSSPCEGTESQDQVAFHNRNEMLNQNPSPSLSNLETNTISYIDTSKGCQKQEVSKNHKQSPPYTDSKTTNLKKPNTSIMASVVEGLSKTTNHQKPNTSIMASVVEGLSAILAQKNNPNIEKTDQKAIKPSAFKKIPLPCSSVRVKCDRPLTCPFNSVLPTTFTWKVERLDLPESHHRDINVQKILDKNEKPKFHGRTLLKGGVEPRVIPLKRTKKSFKEGKPVDPRLSKRLGASFKGQPPERHLSTVSEAGSCVSGSSIDSGLADIEDSDVNETSSREIRIPENRQAVNPVMDNVSKRLQDLIDRNDKNENLGGREVSNICDSNHNGSTVNIGVSNSELHTLCKKDTHQIPVITTRDCRLNFYRPRDDSFSNEQPFSSYVMGSDSYSATGPSIADLSSKESSEGNNLLNFRTNTVPNFSNSSCALTETGWKDFLPGSYCASRKGDSIRDVFETVAGECRSENYTMCDSELRDTSLSHQPICMSDARQRIQDIRAFKALGRASTFVQKNSTGGPTPLTASKRRHPSSQDCNRQQLDVDRNSDLDVKRMKHSSYRTTLPQNDLKLTKWA